MNLFWKLQKMLSKLPICTILAEADLAQTKALTAEVERDSTFFELRADFLSNLNEELIYSLKKILKLPTIFTLRDRENGGQFVGSNSEKLNFYRQAVDASYEYLDLELDSPLIDVLDRKKSKLIVSYHNFSATPSLAKLRSVIVQAQTKKPDLIKIATFVNQTTDLQVLAKLLLDHQIPKQLIVVGMGELGKPSRVLFPYLGSFLTYAVFNNKITSGQLSLSEMQKYAF